MKTLILLMLSILLLGCGAQSMRSYQGKAHNTQGNPKFGYKFNPKDTVYDNATGVVYRIDSIDTRNKDSRYYYATDLYTGGTVIGLVEKVLIKYNKDGK